MAVEECTVEAETPRESEGRDRYSSSHDCQTAVSGAAVAFLTCFSKHKTATCPVHTGEAHSLAEHTGEAHSLAEHTATPPRTPTHFTQRDVEDCVEEEKEEEEEEVEEVEEEEERLQEKPEHSPSHLELDRVAAAAAPPSHDNLISPPAGPVSQPSTPICI
ncbi:unnamed protein product [Pleuronectes platessa]|uniref:Uncharacterized protein n=1 Tax=Pleuronectes platessa TaxID=8262 RepID=A0A9N7TZ50_PLEPL|nr:unnamed protein product [Pleuronectes platessa]